MPEKNVFAGRYLEREGHLRADPAWLESALADPRSRVLPVWNSLNLVAGGESAASPSGAADDAMLRAVLLGRRDGTNLFAYEVESDQPPAIPEGTRFAELRTVAALMPEDQAGLLGYARAMVNWRRTHRHCGQCGALTVPAKA